MTTTEPADDLARVHAFERALRHAIATEVTRLPFGEVALTSDLAEVFDINLVVVEATAMPDPEEVRTMTEKVLGDVGASHRKARYEDGAALEAATATFKEAGWERVDHVIMRHVGARPAWPTDAAILTDPQSDDLRARLTRARPWFSGNESLAQTFVTYGDRTRTAGKATIVGILDADGRAVAHASIYGDGPVRQIEEVEVVADAQAKGLGRTLMLAALHLALDGDPELVYLVADTDDWPRHWYARIGFEQIGTTGEFFRSLK